MSIDEFASTTPVRPPIVNRNTNPRDHKHVALYVNCDPYTVAKHLKILIPVGTGVIILVLISIWTEGLMTIIQRTVTVSCL
jgi:hypothetical protein